MIGDLLRDGVHRLQLHRRRQKPAVLVVDRATSGRERFGLDDLGARLRQEIAAAQHLPVGQPR